MPTNLSDPVVLTIAMVALFISLLSAYVSRVYLPAKIKNAYRKSITVLAAAVETKDSGTVGHAQRVAGISMEIAKRMKLSGRNLDRVEYAALLRDVGKAVIPQSILNKTDRLTPEEWAAAQKHAELGAEMAAAVPFLADTADCILHHHEYWDGSGYPDGLKGEEIPLISRILAIASDYDAMISERPYHPRALDPDEAIEEIRASSGVRYDPAVVEVFMEVLADRVSNAKLRAA